MARIVIPKDRDVAARLATRIADNTRTLGKEQGVALAPPILRGLRLGRRVSGVLKKAEAMRAKADDLSHGVDGDVATIRRGLGDAGNSLLRQTRDGEAVKKWGFAFKEGRGKKTE